MTRPADIYLRFLQLAEALKGLPSLPPLDPLEERILEFIARVSQKNDRLSVRDMMAQSQLGSPATLSYERSSPTTYFAAIKAPLLVLQGENDIRDPKEEAEQAFKALTAAGKTVQAHYYPGEGHGSLSNGYATAPGFMAGSGCAFSIKSSRLAKSRAVLK